MTDVVVKATCDTTIVEVYTCPPPQIIVEGDGGGGGSGAFYVGENVGDGAGVYKETDNTTDPRVHRFKSLTQGNGIIILEGDDTINIAAQQLAGTGTVTPGTPIGVLSGGCGPSTSFYPTTLGGLVSGDLMIWLIITSSNPSGAPSFVVPAGWEVLWRGVYEANDYHFMSYLYRWADATDLEPTKQHVASRSAGQGNTLCSSVFFFRSINRNMPFAGAVGATAQVRPYVPFIPISLPYSPVIAACQSVDTSNGWGGVGYMGPAWDHVQTHAPFYASGPSRWSNAYFASRRASNDEDENWVPGESMSSSGTGPGWTNTFVAVTRSGSYMSRLDGINGTNGRHMIERTVNLTAGVNYTFGFLMRAQWQSGDENLMTISYVDPAGNERLLNIKGTGGEINSGACLRYDPLGDLGTTWINGTTPVDEDGVPSTTGCNPMIWFTALTTGAYKLRIGIAGSSVGQVYTSGSGENRRFHGILFRKGWGPYRRVHTPLGEVYQGSGRSAAAGPAWTSVGGGAGRKFTGFALNPVADQLPKAIISMNIGAPGDMEGSPLTDNLTIPNFQATTDDYAGVGVANRPVMPTVNSVYQKYYMEWQVIEPGTENSFGFCYPLFGDMAHDARGGYPGYYWQGSDNGSYFVRVAASVGGPDVAQPTSLPLGTVVGGLVDFVNKEVKFYRDGLLVKTISMIDTYPTGGGSYTGIQAYMPLWAFARCCYTGGTGDGGSVKFNMAGPFAYPVPGALPYDWAGATELDYVAGIEPVGDGTSLVTGSDTNPQVKSLKNGRNVVLDDDGENITINADIPVPILRGAAWSDATAIDKDQARPVSIVCPHAGVIKKYTVLGDASGSAQITVSRSTFTSFPSLEVLCGTNKPKLVSQQKSQDTVLAGWTTQVNTGDILTFTLDSCSGLKLLSVQVEIEEII